MIILYSDEFKKVNEILNESLKSKNFSDWTNLLDNKEKTYIDGFLNFLDHPKANIVLSKLNLNSFNEWFRDVQKWHSEILNPLNEIQPEALILYQLWESMKSRLETLIKSSKLCGEIPHKGGILYYLSGLSKCIVLKFELVTEYPKIEIVDIIDNPKSVFDFWGIINQTSVMQKNILKEILSSGHKIIVHRGSLIHVDRRKDLEVFGPSIDTLLLAEVLAQLIYESEKIKISKALEIGCGNGLLTVSLAKNLKTLNEFYTIDINFCAINCTNRNLKGNISQLKMEQMKSYLIAGEFNPKIFNTKFDLIVSNPPYIPLIDTNEVNLKEKKNFFQAVGGIELIGDILKSLDFILAKNGLLLLLVSNISLEYTISLIPDGYEYSLPIKEGYEVLFDVEAVLNNSKWLNYLINSHGLIKKDETYFHRLFPIWIYRKENGDENGKKNNSKI